MSLFDSLSGLKTQLLDEDAIRTDNLVFRLHYRWTVTFLLAFSVLLSLSQYAGDPIDCILKHSMEGDTFDNYCWVEGTYTSRRKMEFGEAGAGVKGDLGAVHCFEGKGQGDPDSECWHHQYYQWVALVLVFQAGCFYFPRYLWQIWEDGRVSSLVSGLDRRTLVRGMQTRDALSEGKVGKRLRELLQQWREARGANGAWAAKYYACEVLSMLNVVGQFYLTDLFLDGHFGRIATEGIGLEEHDSVLPILAECRISLFGKGGDEQRLYGLCVLPLNIVNQKFYTIFWFWLSFLQIATTASLLFRAAAAVSPGVRKAMLRYRYGIRKFNKSVVTHCGHGDWLLLTSLVSNMNGVVASFFLAQLGELKEYEAMQWESEASNRERGAGGGGAGTGD